MEYVQLEGIHIHEDGYAKFIELTLNKFDREHGRIVSYKWYNPEFPKEDLVRKVRSGEIFI